MLTPNLALVSKYLKTLESVNSCICSSVTCLEYVKSPLHPTKILQQPADPLLILHSIRNLTQYPNYIMEQVIAM